MAIDFNTFLGWAKETFGEDILVSKNEIRINSPFSSGDTGYHMWCNPSGGKKKVKHGVFRCFKSEKKGSLISLVMQVDNCGYELALEKLNGEYIDLSKDIDFFNEDFEEEKEEKEKIIKFPEFCCKIDSANYYWKKHATNYLTERKIPTTDFYICYDGVYKNRILIPYWNENKELIYWNTRALGNSKLRYRGPEKEIGVGKSDVLYFPKQFEKGSLLYITEGEFDAYSLCLCGLNAVACGGKSLSDKQAIKLSEYKIALSLDTDKAGLEALPTMVEKLEMYGVTNIMLIRPAVGYKDWNEMLKALGPKVVYNYVGINKKPINLIDLII
jgi:DNA primase